MEEAQQSTEKACNAAGNVGHGEAKEVSKPTKGTVSTRKKNPVQADNEIKEA